MEVWEVLEVLEREEGKDGRKDGMLFVLKEWGFVREEKEMVEVNSIELWEDVNECLLDIMVVRTWISSLVCRERWCWKLIINHLVSCNTMLNCYNIHIGVDLEWTFWNPWNRNEWNQVDNQINTFNQTNHFQLFVCSFSITILKKQGNSE